MKLEDICINEEDGKLTALADAAEQHHPDIKDVVKNFPNTYKKAIHVLLAKSRLMYNGKAIYDGSHNGEAIEDAYAAAKEAVKGQTVEVDVDMDGSHADMDDATSYTIEAEVDDAEPVWAGYSVKNGDLYVGLDAWLNENEFNEKWDHNFERTFGEDHDLDNPAHDKIFQAAWKTWIEHQHFQGVLVRVSGDHAEVVETRPGGFHKGILHGHGSYEISSQKIIPLE